MPWRPATLSPRPGRPALINASLAEQMPPGVTLVELAHLAATLTFEAVWHQGELPLIRRSLEVAAELAKEAGWL